MVRVLPTVVALLAMASPLLSPLSAQTPQPAPAAADHTVVRGETLWDLAQRYLGNPYAWSSIHDLNRDLVPNPHWIYPGQTLQIPGLLRTAEVVGPVGVIPAEGQPMAPPMGLQQVARGGGPGPNDPTVFRSGDGGLGSTVITREVVPWPAVSRDAFHAAGWIDPVEEIGIPTHDGVLSGFEGVAARTGDRRTASLYSEVRVAVTGARTPAPGSLLLAFRAGAMVPGEGRIVLPTGLLAVQRVDGDGIVARVERLFDRVLLDDLVVVAPAYTVLDGIHPSPVDAGLQATILAFARPHELQIRGDVGFLDVGAAHGVVVGDEFIVVTAREEGWSGTEAGLLQVVAVRDRTAAVRIVQQDGAVFHAGVPVRLARKMP